MDTGHPAGFHQRLDGGAVEGIKIVPCAVLQRSGGVDHGIHAGQQGKPVLRRQHRCHVGLDPVHSGPPQARLGHVATKAGDAATVAQQPVDDGRTDKPVATEDKDPHALTRLPAPP